MGSWLRFWRQTINLNFSYTKQTMANPSLLRFLVDMRGEDTTTTQLRDDLITMLIAGHETTASALTWALFELVQRPELLKEVRGGTELWKKTKKTWVTRYFFFHCLLGYYFLGSGRDRRCSWKKRRTGTDNGGHGKSWTRSPVSSCLNHNVFFAFCFLFRLHTVCQSVTVPLHSVVSYPIAPFKLNLNPFYHFKVHCRVSSHVSRTAAADSPSHRGGRHPSHRHPPSSETIEGLWHLHCRLQPSPIAKVYACY